MSETGNSDKTVTAAPPKATLHLKRPVEAGIVRQSFSHGRSKAVVVEKVKRRMIAPGETHAPREANLPPPAAAADVVGGYFAFADGRGTRIPVARPFRGP